MTISIPSNIPIPTVADAHPHALRALAEHDAPIGTRAAVEVLIGERILSGASSIHRLDYRRDADGWHYIP